MPSTPPLPGWLCPAGQGVRRAAHFTWAKKENANPYYCDNSLLHKASGLAKQLYGANADLFTVDDFAGGHRSGLAVDCQFTLGFFTGEEADTEEVLAWLAQLAAAAGGEVTLVDAQ